MSYTPFDEAWDQFYEDRYRRDVIEDFTTERLQSFYTRNPAIATNALQSHEEARNLLADGHPSASLVFAVSAIEQFLKVTLLRPVIYGLVHHEPLADVIVEFTLGQTGFDRYNKLLAGLFEKLAGIDITNVKRQSSSKKLLEEAAELQKLRNKIIHQGLPVSDVDAQVAIETASAVSNEILERMLNALGLQLDKIGRIVQHGAWV
jgi:hypothetical protein